MEIGRWTVTVLDFHGGLTYMDLKKVNGVKNLLHKKKNYSSERHINESTLRCGFRVLKTRYPPTLVITRQVYIA
jgi:hypothetical protein